MSKKYFTEEERKLIRWEYLKKYRDNHKEERKEYNKEYNKNNKEKLKEKRENHKEEKMIYDKEYRENNKEKYYIYQKEYRENNKEKRNEYINHKSKIDINYRLARNLRSRISNALKGNWKTGSAIKDMGCVVEELKTRFEGLFTSGMNWENYGEWHIDHIIPLSSFDLSNREEFLKACHYTNLQPLWAEENLSKGDKSINKDMGVNN